MNANEFDRIYLTLYDPGSDDEGPVWWCEDRIDDSDVEYVPRAALDALVERIAGLEELNASYYRALQRAGDYIEQLEEAAT